MGVVREQVVDHIAHHFERGGTRADDDPCPQFGNGDTGAPQRFCRQLSGAQMV